MKIHNTEVIIDIFNGSFGDGKHSSTIVTLEALYEANPKGKKVLDIGTGSGIQSIFAKKWGASEVLAVDVEYGAIIDARNNFVKNNVDVKSKLNIFNEDLDFQADIIIANLPAGDVRRFIPLAKNTLKKGGLLICSFPKKFNFFNECDIHEYDLVRQNEYDDYDAFTLKLK